MLVDIIKKIWHDPVGSKVISSAIIALLGAAVALWWVTPIFGLSIFAVVVLVVWGIVRFIRWSSGRSRISRVPSKIAEQKATAESGLIDSFCLRRHQVVAHVHEAYALKFDPQMGRGLEELNAKRQVHHLKAYYESTCFRLIFPPLHTDSGIELHLAPISFAYVIALTDQAMPADIKQHAHKQLDEVANRIDHRLPNSHRFLNGRNFHPLGTEIVLITKDNRTLLRKRGASVMLATVEWDVSYSGYCREEDKLSEGNLDIAHTAERELVYEIGTIPADNRLITFTGLYRNPTTGAIDMLAFWKTEAEVELIVNLLAKKYPNLKKVFKTTRQTNEQYVWDAQNLIVDFNGPAIDKALRDIGSREQKALQLIPEARMALGLALKAAN